MNKDILIASKILVLTCLVGFSTIIINQNLSTLNDNLELITPMIEVGNYNNETKVITINVEDQDIDGAIDTFLHEWAHYIWFEYLYESERIEYCALNITEHVTDYAKTNCEEDFAETYMIWALDEPIPEPQSSWFDYMDSKE